MQKLTYGEYLNNFFKPVLNEFVAFDIHSNFLVFDCHDLIKDVLNQFKREKDLTKLFNYCDKLLDSYEFDEENDEQNQEVNLLLNISISLKCLSDLNNCIFLKTKEYGLFNNQPDLSVKTPKQFLKMFRGEFLNGITEFLKLSKNNFAKFAVLNDKHQYGFSSFKRFIDQIFKLEQKLISRKENYAGDTAHLKSVYDLCEKIIWHQQELIDKYGWDEENECLCNEPKPIYKSKNFEYYNKEYEVAEKEVFQIFDSFLDSFTQLLLVYELTIEKVEEKYLIQFSDNNINDLGFCFLEDYNDRIKELLICGEEWIYSSYCTFLSN